MSERKYTFGGIALTVIFTAAFILAFGYMSRAPWNVREDSGARARANERQAYYNVLKIAEAQQKYRAADWNGDGLRNYARFLPHLWQTIDGSGRPVRTRLIPRSLAFAVGPASALDGYYYELLYRKGTVEKPRLIDYQDEWAVAAKPARPGQTGRVVFMCGSGTPVLAGPLGIGSRILPLNPAREGWKAVSDSEGLTAFPNALDNRK